MERLAPDIAPERIRSQLSSQVIGRRLEILGTVDSTNTTAMAAGRRGEEEGLCVLADRQAAGRGRRGRVWASPPGLGLYTSILLRPAMRPPGGSLLTLAAGVAVVEAIEKEAGLLPRLKWPNDVLLGGRKVAGILTEMATEGARVACTVVGVGINVNQRQEDFPAGLAETATSLRLACGRAFARGDLAAALYNRLDVLVRRLLRRRRGGDRGGGPRPDGDHREAGGSRRWRGGLERSGKRLGCGGGPAGSG